jgi:hypothetical protein
MSEQEYEQLTREWEAKLAEFGLSEEQIAEKEAEQQRKRS